MQVIRSADSYEAHKRRHLLLSLFPVRRIQVSMEQDTKLSSVAQWMFEILGATAWCY